MDEGYIKLSRKFFSNDMWKEARTFSGCEAWLDLIQSARFEATPRTVSIGGREVSYNRGQYPASIRFLSNRWNWTERKVRTFLAFLKREKMITISSKQGINVITLVKYSEYNSTLDDTANDTTDGTGILHGINDLRAKVTQPMTQQTTQTEEKRHTGDTNLIKEKKDIKKESTNVDKKDAALAATLSRKENFRQSLVPLVEKYGKDMISAFFDYWSEMNKSCTKMRFEQQPTWETAKRLATWAKRDKTYENNRRNYTSKQAANDYAMQQYLLERERVAQGVHDETPKPF